MLALEAGRRYNQARELAGGWRVGQPAGACRIAIAMNRSSAPSTPSSEDPLAELGQHRTYLVRYAMLQLRDPVWAEDAVQETLVAALENQGQFAGKATVRSWLTGILKHKIIDHFRAQAREAPASGFSGSGDAEEAAEEFDVLFDGRGSWDDKPSSWGDPEKCLENKRFWEIFELCAKLMSVQVARVFMMREILGLSTGEICKDINITPTHCWVMLYRARMSLRLCLENKWLGKAGKGK